MLLNKIKTFLHRIFIKKKDSLELNIIKDKIQSLEDDVHRLKQRAKII